MERRAPTLGTTIDGYAVEGGYDADGPMTSFCIAQSTGAVAPSIRSSATLERLPELVCALGDLGVGEIRLTTEWARLEPRPDEVDDEGFAAYERAVAAAERRGMSVVVLLCDVAWPSWVGQEPWLSSWAPVRFAAHAAAVAERLGDRVRAVVTFRAPNVAVAEGWVHGTRPPFRRAAWADAASALDGMLLAHQLAADALAASAPSTTRAMLFGAAPSYGGEGRFRDLALGVDEGTAGARAAEWRTCLERRGLGGHARHRGLRDLDVGSFRSTARWRSAPPCEWWVAGDEPELLAATMDHAAGAVATVELGAGARGWARQLDAVPSLVVPAGGATTIHLHGALSSTGPLPAPRGLLDLEQHSGRWELLGPPARVAEGLAKLRAP